MAEEVCWSRCLALAYAKSSELDAESFERRLGERVRVSAFVPLDARLPLAFDIYGAQVVSRDSASYYVLVVFSQEVAVGSREQLADAFKMDDGSDLHGNWPQGESSYYSIYMPWMCQWLCIMLKAPTPFVQARFASDVQSCIGRGALEFALRGADQCVEADGVFRLIGRRINLYKTFGRQVMQRGHVLRSFDGKLFGRGA